MVILNYSRSIIHRITVQQFAIFLCLVCLALSNSALAQDGPMTFEYKDDHFPGITDFRFIYADGVIAQGTAERFSHFVKDKKISGGAVVIFNSLGGSVGEALEIGRLIRAAGFDTDVGTKNGKDGVCFSACSLAFLGGVRRTIGSQKLFGVHRVSTTASLTSSEALDMGQITIGQIVEYVSYMGVKAEFVTVLTQTGSEDINLLSSQSLKDLNVTTTPFVTSWEIKAFGGRFYVLGTTDENGGVDKIIFLCAGRSRVDAQFLFNSTGEYRASALRWTKFYVFDFDGNEVYLTNDEVSSTVAESGPKYIFAVVHLTTRLLNLLRNTSVLGFEMVPPSRQIYAGWHMDFAGGKEKVFEYIKSCR
jgi:hypothetical protein